MKLFLFLMLFLPLANSYSMELPELFGSFRYRYERIDKEGSSIRNRQRLKAVLGIKSKVDEKFNYTFSLISGSTDPVSGNQTLSDGASSKGVHIDQAELNYTSAWRLTVGGGKMKNPFFSPGKTELIWDGDFRPEGLKLNYSHNDEKWSIASTIAHYELEERKSESNTTMDGVQFVAGFDVSSVNTKLGGSIFNYSHIKSRATLYDSTESFGNTTNGSGQYATGFTIQEFFAEVSTKIGLLPVSVFADFAINDDADEDNKASLFGLTFGKAKEAGSWKLAYNYRKVEKDAVLGVYTDSDFKGGGTDGKGHELGFKYATTDHSSLGLTHFINETSVKNPSTSKDYSRTQLDFSLKF